MSDALEAEAVRSSTAAAPRPQAGPSASTDVTAEWPSLTFNPRPPCFPWAPLSPVAPWRTQRENLSWSHMTDNTAACMRPQWTHNYCRSVVSAGIQGSQCYSSGSRKTFSACSTSGPEGPSWPLEPGNPGGPKAPLSPWGPLMPAAPIIPWDDEETALLVNATQLFSDVDPTVTYSDPSLWNEDFIKPPTFSPLLPGSPLSPSGPLTPWCVQMHMLKCVSPLRLLLYGSKWITNTHRFPWKTHGTPSSWCPLWGEKNMTTWGSKKLLNKWQRFRQDLPRKKRLKE